MARIIRRIDSIILDFFASEDLPDAVAALKELNAPYLSFEVVKRLISHSLDQGNRQREGASVFLADVSQHSTRWQVAAFDRNNQPLTFVFLFVVRCV
jgi:hypothetical protein